MVTDDEGDEQILMVTDDEGEVQHPKATSPKLPSGGRKTRSMVLKEKELAEKYKILPLMKGGQERGHKSKKAKFKRKMTRHNMHNMNTFRHLRHSHLEMMALRYRKPLPMHK
jgi:hypothetical protein